jgi:hypothetical protein
MTTFVAVQEIVGQRVIDPDGCIAGRIESIRAEKIGPRCVIHEYHLGTEAFLSRIGASTVHLFGISTRLKLLRVPWQDMDFSDPHHPRLRCTIEELKAMQDRLPPFEDESPPKRQVAKEK